MARRLKTIARWVNENLGSYGYHATVKPHYYGYTVGKVGRLIAYSGERYGNLFECWELTDLEDKYDEPNTYRRRSLTQFSGMEGIWRRIYSHNTAEPYRNNAEVEGFVRGLVKRIREENPDADVANYEAEEFGAESATKVYVKRIVNGRDVGVIGEIDWDSYDDEADVESFVDAMNTQLDVLYDESDYNNMIFLYLTTDPQARLQNPYYGAEDDFDAYTVYMLKGKYSPDEDWEVIANFDDMKDATDAFNRFTGNTFALELVEIEEILDEEENVIDERQQVRLSHKNDEENYEAEEFEAEGEEDWRERFFKNPQVLTRNGKDIALVDDRTRSGNFGGITIIHPIEGGDSQDGWYGDTTQIVYSNGKLDYIEMPGGERAYADEMKTHYAEEFGAEYDWRGWDESGRNTVKKYQRFGWDIVKTEYWKHPEDSTKESYYEVRKIMEDGTQIDEEISYTKNVFGEGYMWRGYEFGNLKSVLSFIDEKTEMLRKEHGAESFQSETQATVISSLVSLGALGVGILLGKKLFFDEKVLG